MWPKRILLGTLLLIGCGLIASALATLHADRSALAAMESFILKDSDASDAGKEDDTGEDGGAMAYGSDDVDWDALSSSCPQAGLWLTVTGTGISTAVAIDTESNQGYWLTHDLWGNESSVGNPYLDWRCAQSGVKYIYGHHLNSSGGFTRLSQVSDASGLQALGEALLISPDGVETYTPAYALRVEESYLHLRYVPSPSGVREWISRVRSDAYCANPLVESVAQDPEGVLVLITCRNAFPGETERIAIVFVH